MPPTIEHSARIYCDFDGTVTLNDTTDFLLERLADKRWLEFEDQWERGEIGSRECMAQQIPLIQGGWDAVKEVLADVKLDPSFKSFVAWSKNHHIPLYIVSEGLDKVIHFLLQRDGIEVDAVWANRLVTADNQLSLSFPYASTASGCSAGLCKCQILFQEAGIQNRVVIGDGKSDVCWSIEADWLFAKSKLLAHCNQNAVPCFAFDNFNTIQSALEEALFSRKAGHKKVTRKAPIKPIVLPAHKEPINVQFGQSQPSFGT